MGTMGKEELGVQMTPKIKGWSFNEINLLVVSPIRGVSAVGRKSSFKGQVIS
jgi:hypothetical protein